MNNCVYSTSEMELSKRKRNKLQRTALNDTSATKMLLQTNSRAVAVESAKKTNGILTKERRKYAGRTSFRRNPYEDDEESSESIDDSNDVINEVPKKRVVREAARRACKKQRVQIKGDDDILKRNAAGLLRAGIDVNCIGVCCFEVILMAVSTSKQCHESLLRVHRQEIITNDVVKEFRKDCESALLSDVLDVHSEESRFEQICALLGFEASRTLRECLRSLFCFNEDKQQQRMKAFIAQSSIVPPTTTFARGLFAKHCVSGRYALLCDTHREQLKAQPQNNAALCTLTEFVPHQCSCVCGVLKSLPRLQYSVVSADVEACIDVGQREMYGRSVMHSDHFGNDEVKVKNPCGLASFINKTDVPEERNVELCVVQAYAGAKSVSALKFVVVCLLREAAGEGDRVYTARESDERSRSTLPKWYDFGDDALRAGHVRCDDACDEDFVCDDDELVSQSATRTRSSQVLWKRPQRKRQRCERASPPVIATPESTPSSSVRCRNCLCKADSPNAFVLHKNQELLTEYTLFE